MEKIAVGTINVVVSVVKGTSKNGTPYQMVLFENDNVLGQKVSFVIQDDTPSKLIANLIKDKVCTPIVDPNKKDNGKK